MKKHDDPDLLVLPTDAVVFTDDGFRLVKAVNRHVNIRLLNCTQTEVFISMQQPFWCFQTVNTARLSDRPFSLLP